MSLEAKRYLIAAIGLIFLLSLVVVQWIEAARRAERAGLREATIAVPVRSKDCAECHDKANPGLVARWEESSHAASGIGCLGCHQAADGDADAYLHYGALIATVVTPRDCTRCHEREAEEFAHSRHAGAAAVFASLDGFLGEIVQGAPADFMPSSAAPGRMVDGINGQASTLAGCQQCHGSRVAFSSTDGGMITVDELLPDESGRPTNLAAVERIVRDDKGRPILHPGHWPNTGVGRLNLDGSRGSCSACHGRHDFSRRQARQPESCGRCHVGPDHPQMEIFAQSKHGAAYRDRRDELGMDSVEWVLGRDYDSAPTCATCHLSGHLRNGGQVSHDPGQRLSWFNRQVVSLVMDTDVDHALVEENEPQKRLALVHDSAEDKRYRMKEVCSHCHTLDYVNSFYSRYDDLVVLYNEKFAVPGMEIMSALAENGQRSSRPFDEKVEWTWFYLWHHEGRRARHGAAMMAPDYVHWQGMFQVAERFYTELVPQARELADRAHQRGWRAQANATRATIDEILLRPEHEWAADVAAATRDSG